MGKFEKNQIPWNKGVPTDIERCPDCGSFIGNKKEHNCKNIDKRGIRYCKICNNKLKNEGWERYSKICGFCNRKIQRENERNLRHKLVQQFNGKCEICDYNKFEECLEFHHLFKDDKKNKHFLKDIEKHPEKFKLLCNRCHREVHIKLKNLGNNA
jgi:hypothetical protein